MSFVMNQLVKRHAATHAPNQLLSLGLVILPFASLIDKDNLSGKEGKRENSYLIPPSSRPSPVGEGFLSLT